MLPGYDEKIKAFFEEHIHDAEEIRYIIDGSGYFDIRDKEDKWIRIWIKKGDLMTLPEGCYHRFTCDETDFIQAMRLSQVLRRQLHDGRRKEGLGWLILEKGKIQTVSNKHCCIIV
jgi:hypothetical protein